MRRTAQKFGGPWSIFKIETVASYLAAFNRALSKTSFNRIYIDAFAGSGSFKFGDDSKAPLLDDLEGVREVAGSAARALDTRPPFHKVYLLENRRKNIRSLEALVKERSDQACEVAILEGDANESVRSICKMTPWATSRGVIFLDPFGTSVEWQTLRSIAATKGLDVWYLFPLLGVTRNAPLAIDALSNDKKAAVMRVLGTSEWQDHFYAQATETGDLFDRTETNVPLVRSINVLGIEKFVRSRLFEVFPRVEQPARLLGPHNAPMFSLFFAVSNPDQRAQEIASRIARHLLTQSAKGIRPKSGH